jgi:predicted RNA binding protein YcfA (HicA-like mRNA interferase family)
MKALTKQDDRRLQGEYLCVYHTHMTSADLIRRLERAGWVLRATKGSHHIYVHPRQGGHISVPHPKKDLGKGLVQKILKQAGLK